MALTHEHSCTLPASSDVVFAALTEPAQLTRWFAESVDVGDGAGAPFRFWGRHSLDTPSAEMATQRITRWEPGHALGFSWTIGDVETGVSIALEAEGEGCKVRLRHEVPNALPHRRERELIDDHWRLAFGNLAAHLAGGDGIALPDYSDPMPTVHHDLHIDAPVEVVFRALTTPSAVNEWLGAKHTVIEPRVGGRYSVGWQYTIDGRDVTGGPTRILEYTANERLVLDWPDWRGDETVTGQTICFTLEPADRQTRLMFVHAGFGRAADISDYPFGWAWFLGQLRDVATRLAATERSAPGSRQ